MLHKDKASIKVTLILLFIIFRIAMWVYILIKQKNTWVHWNGLFLSLKIQFWGGSCFFFEDKLIFQFFLRCFEDDNPSKISFMKKLFFGLNWILQTQYEKKSSTIYESHCYLSAFCCRKKLWQMILMPCTLKHSAAIVALLSS